MSRPDTITRLGDTFVHTDPSLAIGGGGAGNHSNGVDTLVAVNALNYLVGNLGKTGGLVFNPAPAGQVSHAHQASYRTMLELAEDAQQGKIEVLILNGTNPVFTLPLAAEFRKALAKIPLIVSLSSFMDETTALADIILPSHTYLESWGDDFRRSWRGFPHRRRIAAGGFTTVQHPGNRRHLPGAGATDGLERRHSMEQHERLY